MRDILCLHLEEQKKKKKSNIFTDLSEKAFTPRHQRFQGHTLHVVQINMWAANRWDYQTDVNAVVVA